MWTRRWMTRRRERMDEHASICRSCAKELRDLQAFDARMALGMNDGSGGGRWRQGRAGWSEMTGSVAQFFAHSVDGCDLREPELG